MTSLSVVREVVAKLARKPLGEVQDHLSLRSLGINMSVGLSAARSLLEARLGQKLPPFTADTTVSQLAGLAAGSGTPAPPPAPIPLAADASAVPAAESSGPAATLPAFVGLGLDLQEIDALPDVADLRADPFYADHFAPSELATAALRPSPRAHLCGIFCAKEAAKKSHPALLELRMDGFVVGHEASGRPTLRLADPALARRFAFMISITHTERYAAATCLTTERLG